MVIGAANLWPGVGLILAIVLVTLWYLLPAMRAARFFVMGSETEQPRKLRCGLMTSACAAAVFAAATQLPAPTVVSAPAVVQTRPLAIVHCLSSGCIKRIAIRTGDKVALGEVLVELENLDLVDELQQLRIEMRASSQREIRYLNKGEVAAAEVERSNRKSTIRREEELLRMIDGLLVKAPMAGRVVTRQLDELIGRRLQPGSELLTIASTSRPQLIAMVPQSEAESLRGREGQLVTGWLWGHSRWLKGQVEHIEPRATQVAAHPALTAEAGGPLAVVARDQREEQSTVMADSQWILTEPQLEVVITLDAAGEPLALGETGIVRLPIRTGSLWSYLSQRVQSWWSVRWTTTHGV